MAFTIDRRIYPFCRFVFRRKSGGWDGGVLEYCAFYELHPRSELIVLKRHEGHGDTDKGSTARSKPCAISPRGRDELCSGQAEAAVATL
jgi:hypothetical protein